MCGGERYQGGFVHRPAVAVPRRPQLTPPLALCQPDQKATAALCPDPCMLLRGGLNGDGDLVRRGLGRVINQVALAAALRMPSSAPPAAS